MSEGDRFVGKSLARCADCPFDGEGVCDLVCAALAQDTTVPPVVKLARKEHAELHPESKSIGVPEILEEMARTFRERNAVYADNWKMVGKLMATMFPRGVEVIEAEDYDVWHLFELLIVKLSRFAVSGLNHQDSIHDLAVYAAMIEGILKQRKEPLHVDRR